MVVKFTQKVVEVILWNVFLLYGLGMSCFTGLNSILRNFLWLLFKILLVIWLLILSLEVLLWLLDLILRLFDVLWWFLWILSRPYRISYLFTLGLILLFTYFTYFIWLNFLLSFIFYFIFLFIKLSLLRLFYLLVFLQVFRLLLFFLGLYFLYWCHLWDIFLYFCIQFLLECLNRFLNCVEILFIKEVNRLFFFKPKLQELDKFDFWIRYFRLYGNFFFRF